MRVSQEACVSQTELDCPELFVCRKMGAAGESSSTDQEL